MDASQGYRQLPAVVKKTLVQDATPPGGVRPQPVQPRAICSHLAYRSRAERYAHRMRNGGDRVPGGAAGRRHRPVGPETPARPSTDGGASLFTPAYRASHAPAGPYPGQTGVASLAAAGSGMPPAAAAADHDADAKPPPGSAFDDDDRPVIERAWPEPGEPQADDDQPADDDPAGGYSWAADDLTSAGHSWSRNDLGGAHPAAELKASNAVRGFPPAPGEPLPIYPPGPFAAWNRSAPTDSRGLVLPQARAGGDTDASSQLAVATITPSDFDTDFSIPAIRDPAPGAAGSAGTDVGSRRTRSAPPGAG